MSLNDDNKFNYEGGREMMEKTLASDAQENGCRHTEIARQILTFHNGRVEPLFCPSCGHEQDLPLHCGLDSRSSYVLYCQFCRRVLWREK